MSFTQTALAHACYATVEDVYGLAVLLVLADEADDDGLVETFRLSQAQLAARTKCSERTVRKALAQLRRLHLLAVTERGGNRGPSGYQLTLPPSSNRHDAPESNRHDAPEIGSNRHLAPVSNRHDAPEIARRLSSLPNRGTPRKTSSSVSTSETNGEAAAELFPDAKGRKKPAKPPQTERERDEWALVDRILKKRAAGRLATVRGRPALRQLLRQMAENGMDDEQIVDLLGTASSLAPGSIEFQANGAAPVKRRTNRKNYDEARAADYDTGMHPDQEPV